MRKIWSIAISVVLITIATIGAFSYPSFAARPSPEPDWLGEIRRKLDMSYAYEIIETLGSFKTCDLGFRTAGTDAEHAASEYVYEEMLAMGLTDAAMEAVPVHAWDFRGASLTLHGPTEEQDYTMPASAFAGSPGTPTDGITEELVWVGKGFKGDYEGMDVTGKIVLANWQGFYMWPNCMAFEATLHGAAGIVVATIDSMYGNTEGAMMSFDGLMNPDWMVPLICIPNDEGRELMDRLLTGEKITATMKSDITVDKNGTGYNVVGYLPSERYGTPADEFVILGDHLDGYFEAAMDDAAGVAALLTIAKAFVQSGYKPDRTIIFIAHCAEEYGITNTYFDWCYGAWYSITHLHPEWPGRSVGFMCFELMGMAGLPLVMNFAPELYNLANRVLARNRDLLPYGWQLTPRAHTWADHWTYSAAGVPGMEFLTTNDWWDSYVYHTQFDTISMIDFNYLEMLFKVFVDMALEFDRSAIVPWKFEIMAKALWKKMDLRQNKDIGYALEMYEKYGINPNVNFIPTLDKAELYLEKAHALDAWLKTVDPADASKVNAALMNLTKTLDTTMISISVWEDDWFPHEQSLLDAIQMERCIEILDKTTVTDNDISDAMWELNWVGIIWYYDYLSKLDYLDQIEMLSGTKVKSWGEQTHLLPIVDPWDEYDDLASMLYQEPNQTLVDAIVERLQSKLTTHAIVNLETALASMSTCLDSAILQIDTIMSL